MSDQQAGGTPTPRVEKGAGAAGGHGPEAIDDARPLWSMLKIAAPSVATMMSYTVMQYVDALMVSRIGPEPVYVAAAGNGGVMAFWPISIAMGVVGMVNTYVSQHLGAGTAHKGPAYAWNALWIAVVAWLLLVPYALVLPWVFSLQGHGVRLIELETAYGQTLLFGSVITLGARGMAQFFYGLHRPGVVLTAALCGNLTNFVCNLGLIYGVPELGVPALGVRGAAVATVVGTGVELAIPLWLFLSRSMHERYGTRSAWRPSLGHVRDLVKTGWPAALMYGNEMVCWAVFMSWLVGGFGPEQNTASWIALRYMHMSFMPAVGMSFAITAVVGKCLGAGRPELARRRAWLGIRCAMVYMGVCAVVMVVFREQLAGVLIPGEMAQGQRRVIVEVAAQLLVVAAVFQVFDGLGISIFGALRGGGDTVVPGVVTMVLSWGCIVGLGGWMVKLAPGLGAVGPWIGAGVYIILLGLFFGWRFFGGAWLRRRLLAESSVR